MSSEDIEKWQPAEFMQVALNLKIYRQTLAFSIGNLIIMTLIASLLSLFTIFAITDAFITIIWMIISFSAVLLHLWAFRSVYKQLPHYKHESLIWTISYPFPIFFGYGINYLLLGGLFPPGYLWYPTLGIGCLIIGLSIENYYFKTNNIYTRSSYWLGISLTVSSPLIYVAILFNPHLVATFFIPSIALILTALITSLSMALAEKRVIKK